MSLEIRRVHLECTQGTSYKEYNVIITQRGSKYDLKSTYGRIGGGLTHRDIIIEASLPEAMAEYSKIVKAKHKKGYTIVAEESASRFTPEYVEKLMQKAAVLVAEGALERNHYQGLKKMLEAIDIETLEMAEKIVIANEAKHLKEAA